jgi:hypothetical protein
MRKLLNESGIRNINELAKRYKKAKIYFHQDLDGVTTAIGMKNYLENYGIKVVDAEIIQYGDKEFSIKKPDASGEVMPVLVDFAHGKPMFVIHTDHHDTQAGVEPETSTNFRPSRSNVETISQVVSPKEIFPTEDINIISTVDSANFAVNNITPEMVMNYLLNFDKDSSLRSNKFIMGLVTNKLLLAFKNKPEFLEQIVLGAQPSLLSILNNIKKQISTKGYATPEELVQNQANYIEKQKVNPNVRLEDNIIVQYGGGSMIKPGSYDRYTPFKNNPDADFIVIAWPLGLVQASCNPFKEDRALKGVDLGEMKNVVLSKFESDLKGMRITFGTLKRVSEFEAEYESVGFTLKDLVAIYGNRESFKVNADEKLLSIIGNISQKLYRNLTTKQKDLLDRISVNGWDVIQANSGGHKCITNISGISYLYRNKKEEPVVYDDNRLAAISEYKGSNNFVNDIKSKLAKYKRLSEPQILAAMKQIEKEGVQPQVINPEQITSYVQLTKAIQEEFVKVLKSEIANTQTVTESVKKDNKYLVGNSKIQGKGVFANKKMKKGDVVGLLHNIIELGNEYEFTELGKLHNHSDDPNCHNELVDGKQRFLVVSRDIDEGEELTTDYRLQPDLEQPSENWGGKINEEEGNEDMIPHVDGYRDYSPFKDMEYIIVPGSGIDCDGIVHDLILIGDNGKVKFCKKNSGSHYLNGATKVVEIPVKKHDNVKNILSNKESFAEWLENKLDEIDVNNELTDTFFN